MTEPQIPSAIERRQQEFAPQDFSVWKYRPTIDGDVLPYAKGVNYFNPFGSSVADLDRNNSQAAEAVFLSETALSINNGAGLHVGIGIVKGGQEGQNSLERLKFQLPLTLEEGLSGRQPPIASLYPRVTFPAFGSHPYGIVMMWDEAVFKNGIERFELKIPSVSSAQEIQIPLDVPCHQAIRKALDEFRGTGLFDQGKYSISIEFEKMPLVCLRIDGAMPLMASMLHDRSIAFELPISNFQSSLASMDFLKKFTLNGVTERANPLERRQNSNDKYAEIPVVVGGKDGHNVVVFNTASLEYRSAGERKRDVADLTYVTLSRPESVAESAVNPHLGLVEVQISAVAQLTSINIDFTPERVEKPRSPFEDTFRSASLNLSPTRGMLFSAPPLSTGRTELAKPRSAAALPQSNAEWLEHLHTFRFCLTNEA